MNARHRFECNLESRYVMSQLKSFSVSGASDGDQMFRDGLKKLKGVLGPDAEEAFKCAFVMPKAIQNLDSIYRQERPVGAEARQLMFEVAVCLRHFHNRHLIHGDLKMLNVVRFQDRLRLVDMDSSIILKGGGAKHFGVPGNFSTGLVPPEMIYTFRNDEEVRAYEDYFESFRGTDEGKELYEIFLKPQKGEVHEDKKYCFKALNPVKSVSAPPYAVLEASEALDMWALACMIYNVCASCQLLLADCDDNLCPGAIERLAEWDDVTKEVRVLRGTGEERSYDVANSSNVIVAEARDVQRRGPARPRSPLRHAQQEPGGQVPAHGGRPGPPFLRGGPHQGGGG